MVTHKVGDLVLMETFTVSGEVRIYLGIIKKIDDGMTTCFIEWHDGEHDWYSSETVDEMKSELRAYYAIHSKA